MAAFECRACRSREGAVVLDLGEQPASDYFPPADDRGPDPVYPLRMWLCGSCGLAQLLEDPTVPEEPRATEPAALVEQAAEAVERVAAAGLLREGAGVAEFGSPHGGSWLPLVAQRGLSAVGSDQVADVVIDCFGLMHSPDQAAAMQERAARVTAGGVLLLQYHSLATILRHGQWNALRHGHYAYYSTTVLQSMLGEVGFAARVAWRFELYGGTVLLASTRERAAAQTSLQDVYALIDEEERLGVRDPDRVGRLQQTVEVQAEALHKWLAARRDRGSLVLGYGAASRAVALLGRADVNSDLLPAVADASAAKQGRRMPGTDIPVIAPEDLLAARPQSVLLFLPDLLQEVRAEMPDIETEGGRWVDVEGILAHPS